MSRHKIIGRRKVGAAAWLMLIGAVAVVTACAPAPAPGNSLAAGVASAVTSSPAGNPTSPAPTTSSTSVSQSSVTMLPPVSLPNVSGPTTSPEIPSVALQQSLTGVDPGVILEAHFGDPPAGGAAGRYLYETIAVPQAADGSGIQFMFQAELVEGAVAERIATDGRLLDSIRGIVLTGKRPDGSLIDLDVAGVGNIPSGQHFTGGTDAALIAQTQATLIDLGLTSVQVRVLHPLGPALLVVATASNDLLTNGKLSGLNAALNPEHPCCDGYYLELRTPDGKVAARLANSRRSGSGTFWTEANVTNIQIGVAHG